MQLIRNAFSSLLSPELALLQQCLCGICQLHLKSKPFNQPNIHHLKSVLKTIFSNNLKNLSCGVMPAARLILTASTPLRQTLLPLSLLHLPESFGCWPAMTVFHCAFDRWQLWSSQVMRHGNSSSQTSELPRSPPRLSSPFLAPV